MGRRQSIFSALVAAAFLLAGSAAHGGGGLDSSFGTGGQVTTPVGGGDDELHALVRQPDGKLVVAGSTAAGGGLDFVLARYTASGALDTTFGSGGLVTTPLGPMDDLANALVLLPDGRIVAAGSAEDAGGVADFALARYSTSGALDTTFGSGGIVTTSFTGASGIAALVLQPDGKLVAAGANDDAGSFTPPVFALARYSTSGALDTTFGTGGRVTTSIFTGGNGAGALVLQPDGKVVAAGIAATIFSSSFALVRYQTNGLPDATFGTAGIVTTTVGPGFGGAKALALQDDGKLVAGGGLDGSLSFILVRYQTNGTPDGGFGSGGQATTPFVGPVNSLVIEPDGKIAAAGGNTEFALARYLSTGALDSTFGTGGTQTTSTGGPARALVRVPEGELVAAGWSDDGSDLDLALVRYEGLCAPTSYCQGTAALCPCANVGQPGRGCQNAQSTGGVLLSAQNFLPDGAGGGTITMVGTFFPPALTPAAILIRSAGVEAPPALFGDGLRCIKNAGLIRIQTSFASGGTVSFPVDHGAGTGSFHYQIWYRSNPDTYCTPSAFNLSNGLSIPWP